jgi:hypothetical protein
LPNITTWATETRGGVVKIAVDNLASEGRAQPVSVRVPGYEAATAETLTGSSADASAGISLGASALTADAKWHPRSVKLPRTSRSFRVIVPTASAVIIILHANRPAPRR